MSDRKQMGRLAFRAEGQFWVSYFADPNTMDNATRLGTIRLNLVPPDSDMRGLFVDLMQCAFTAVSMELFGEAPTFSGLAPAPESEKGKGGPRDTPRLRYRLEILEQQLRERAETARAVAGHLHMESPGSEPRLVVGMTMAHHAVYLECADMIRALLA